MVRTQNGRISREIIEAVHDDGHDDVQHDERTQEDERDEVKVGHIGAAFFVWIYQIAGRGVVHVSPYITFSVSDASHHYLRPRFSSRTSK